MQYIYAYICIYKYIYVFIHIHSFNCNSFECGEVSVPISYECTEHIYAQCKWQQSHLQFLKVNDASHASPGPLYFHCCVFRYTSTQWCRDIRRNIDGNSVLWFWIHVADHTTTETIKMLFQLRSIKKSNAMEQWKLPSVVSEQACWHLWPKRHWCWAFRAIMPTSWKRIVPGYRWILNHEYIKMSVYTYLRSHASV